MPKPKSALRQIPRSGESNADVRRAETDKTEGMLPAAGIPEFRLPAAGRKRKNARIL